MLSCVLQCRMVRVWTFPNAMDLFNFPTSNCPSAHSCILPLSVPTTTQEANYAHQQELDMIPLMMQKDYAPKGYATCLAFRM